MKYTMQLSFLPMIVTQNQQIEKREWFRMFLQEAENWEGQPFYFSENRSNIPEATHSKWYRQAGVMLTQNGFVKTGRWRHSPIPSRMNGDDFEYVKVGSSYHHQVTTTPNRALEQCPYSKNKCCPFLKEVNDD